MYGGDSVVHNILFVCKLRATSFAFPEETSLIFYIIATWKLHADILTELDINAVDILLALAILHADLELN